MAVFDRGELDLNQMKFEKNVFDNKKLLANKKNLTAAYQKFVHRALAHGVHLMHVKGLERYKQDFVCKSITIGYFRVPQFRSIFIDAVQKKSESPDVDRYMITDSGSPVVDIDINDLVTQCLMQGDAHRGTMDFFEWNGLCFKYIDQKDAESNMQIIQFILDAKNPNNKNWAERICRRGQSFFKII